MTELTQSISLAQLCQQGRNIDLPVKVNVQADMEPVFCLEMLRFVADKRMVLKAQYQGQTVLLKLFFNTAHQRHCKREINGAEAFLSAQVNAPKIVLTRQKKNCSLMMYQWLDNVHSLQCCWDQADSEQDKNTLVSLAIKQIASLHQAGVEQVDIHLDNFLLQGDSTLYAVDGDLVKNQYQCQSKALPLADAINNLAMFFTQFPVAYDDYLSRFLEEYHQARELMRNTITLPILEKRLFELRKWREKKYVYSKALRSCSEFICKQSWREKVVYRRDSESVELMTLLADPDSYIFSEQSQILKQGKSAVVAKVIINDTAFVIKKYISKNRLHQLSRSLRQTRAEVSWLNGCLLQFIKIPTAKPLALLEKRCGVFRGESYIVNEYIESRHLWAYFHDEQHPPEQIEAMLEQLFNLFKALLRSRISHGDMKMQNILVADEKIYLIDLDGLSTTANAKAFNKAFIDDINRLIRSWDDAEQYAEFIAKLQQLPDDLDNQALT